MSDPFHFQIDFIMRNNQNQSIPIQKLDFSSIPQLEFIRLLNEMHIRASSTITDGEYELQQDMNDIYARCYYLVSDRYSEIC